MGWDIDDCWEYERRQCEMEYRAHQEYMRRRNLSSSDPDSIDPPEMDWEDWAVHLAEGIIYLDVWLEGKEEVSFSEEEDFSLDFSKDPEDIEGALAKIYDLGLEILKKFQETHEGETVAEYEVRSDLTLYFRWGEHNVDELAFNSPIEDLADSIGDDVYEQWLEGEEGFSC